MAGVKTRHPDDLQRSILAVRQAHGYFGEMKFESINGQNQQRYLDLVDLVAGGDCHIVGAVLDARTWNPFKNEDHWVGQAIMIARLVANNMNRNEVATVVMDGITTPAGVSLGRLVKRHANSLLRGNRVTTAISLDSKSNDVMQAADLVASSIRRQRFEAPSNVLRPKDAVAARLAMAFGVSRLTDCTSGRVRLETMSAPPSTIRAIS